MYIISLNIVVFFIVFIHLIKQLKNKTNNKLLNKCINNLSDSDSDYEIASDNKSISISEKHLTNNILNTIHYNINSIINQLDILEKLKPNIDINNIKNQSLQLDLIINNLIEQIEQEYNNNNSGNNSDNNSSESDNNSETSTTSSNKSNKSDKSNKSNKSNKSDKSLSESDIAFVSESDNE